jgi:catechol 2,3-dioxygenase-like lactoylglutathione lyase family enzyme
VGRGSLSAEGFGREVDFLPGIDRQQRMLKGQGRAEMIRVVTVRRSLDGRGELSRPWGGWLPRMNLEQVALIVDDYDDAIRYFVEVLGFQLVEDSPSVTNDGRPKRWVVVRPPGASTALLLAEADGERQRGAVGDQFAGRVGLFLRVEDFAAAYGRMRALGVEFLTEPRQEPYGQVAVFLDIAGNRWDLLGPRPQR